MEAERVKIQREVIDNFKQSLFWTGVNLSKTIPALAIMLLCVAAGLPLGLNILPSAVACKSVDSLCYHLRLNKKTTIAPDKSVLGKRVVPLKKKSKERK
ncbi:MAG: hypothetical protein KME30_26160 [Iphinoe sp. HA4291-MV1]|nr:hypothetical protein [Iphinoe sp. HA4291-MV1]